MSSRVGRQSLSFLALVVALSAIASTGRAQTQAPVQAAPQDPKLQEADRLFKEAKALQKDGKVRDAIDAAQKATALIEEVRSTHLDTADAFADLGSLQLSARDYAGAAKSFERVVAIQEKLIPDSKELGESLNDLGTAYRRLGDTGRTVTVWERSLQILRKNLSDEDREVFAAMHNLGDLYSELGDYNRAQPLMEQSLALAIKKLGPEDMTVAIFLNNIARLRMARGELEQAEDPYMKSLAIREKLLKPNDPSIARLLGNMGVMYQERALLPKAEVCYSRALDIYRASIGEQNADAATLIHNLAVLHLLRRDFDGAEPLYKRALEIRRATLGATHPDVAKTLEATTILHWLRGDSAAAAATQQQANDIQEHHLTNVLAVGSEQQKVAFMDTLRETFDLTLTLRTALPSRAVDDLAANTVLRRKGRVLDAMADSLAAVTRAASPADRAVLGDLSRVRGELANLAMSPPAGVSVADRQKRQDALYVEAQALESRLSQAGAALRAESQSLTVADVRSQLPVDSTLIEYMEYHPFDPRVVGRAGRFGAPRYAAMVLTREGQPSWFELGDAATIDAAVAAWRGALARPDRDDVGRLGRRLDALVMEPLAAALGRPARLLIAPDGALALVPFGALVDPQQRFRLSAYEIALLSSGRDVLRVNHGGAAAGPALVVANPAFDAGGGANGSSAARFAPLPGTAAEAAALARLMPKATVLTGAEATEARLKAAVSPAVLHVATHGFFSGRALSASTQTDTRGLTAVSPANQGSALDPLTHSGLALAGANHPSAGSSEDGLLTAVEAASLNLSGTELVVLSACETGVGEVRAGDGVQGLRRALTMAGAASQVMSLWQVSDEATRELMESYYRELMDGKGRAAALRDVQLAMQRRAGRAHPFYWAAFIFAGDWQPLVNRDKLR
jgi:CHAT domain-containing protein